MKKHINLENKMDIAYCYKESVCDCWVAMRSRTELDSNYYLVCDGRNLNVKVYVSPITNYVFSSDLYKKIKSIL